MFKATCVVMTVDGARCIHFVNLNVCASSAAHPSEIFSYNTDHAATGIGFIFSTFPSPELRSNRKKFCSGAAFSETTFNTS